MPMPMPDTDALSRIGIFDEKLIATAACAALVWTLWLLFRPDSEKAVDFSVPAPEQCKLGWRGKELLSGPSIKVPGSSAIQCYAPATGQLLGLINPSSPDRIDRVVAKAAAAQQSWKNSTFPQRRKVLKTILKFILVNQEDVLRAACLDSGKTRTDAVFGEMLVTVEKLKWTIKHGEKALRPDPRPTNLLMFYKKNEVRYEPMGVVAACVSWNYPFHNLIGPIISAIFAGNAIIIKNSEQTAWSSVYFVTIVREAIQACGFDPDLVHAISCWPQTADYFTSHPGISHLTFIGSKPVAHDVAKSASKALTPLCVELGGKDAAIVLDEPNGRAMSKGEMSRVASIIMRGVFQSSGQNCVGIERVISMPEAYRILVEMLEPRIKTLRLGNDLDPDNSAEGAGIDVGAMISPASFDRLEGLIAEARAQGARLLVGGHRYRHERYPLGHYFMPTLLVDVTPQMRIAQEELFAPVCVMMRAGSVDEAIKITNSTIYGLGCSVFGPTSSQGSKNLSHVTASVKAGMVAVNDFACYYVVQLPFGGVGGSGYGRFAGEEGLRSLCNTKSVCADRWPGLIKTAIPAPLDYPMRSTAWDVARALVEVVGYEGLAGKWRGVRRLAGF